MNKKKILLVIIMPIILIIFALFIDHINKEELNKKSIKENAKPIVINTIDKKMYNGRSNVKLNVPVILQNPELPTGCEFVSLTAVLNYFGDEPLDKTYLVNNYMIQSNNVRNGYVGDPYSKSGAGCFQNTLIKIANNYLNEWSNYRAFDISGSSLIDMHYILDSGVPIIIWSTISYVEPEIDKSNLPIGDHEFYRYEHCIVLTGYDLKTETFYVMDPLKGDISVNRDTIYDIYVKVGKYAMIIDKL